MTTKERMIVALGNWMRCSHLSSHGGATPGELGLVAAACDAVAASFTEAAWNLRQVISEIPAMTPAEKEAQRRSFAYGNAAVENPAVTREMIDEEAEKLAAEEKDGGGK